ncbi:MAG: cation:proton antiporter [Chloroflexi bacterium]|nr:cation:proton antiporter [Chloroflexota bacterium]
MENLWIAAGAGALILAASILSVELGISVAILEILLGVVAGNFLGLHTTPWMDFLASFASIVLTFLAGAEVDPQLLRTEFKSSILLGGLSFLLPFGLAMVFALVALGWTLCASQIAGIALSTTSLAVVYAVLVETGLTETRLGKIIMSATFVTDFGTALTLSLLFITPGWELIVFVVVSIALLALVPRLAPWFFRRYGDRVIEPEIKLIFFVLLVLMLLAEFGASHAVLPAFIFGLTMARVLQQYRTQQRRLRVVTFALLTPFFFLKSGFNVSLPAVAANLPAVVLLLGVKLAAKGIGVFPVARRYVPQDATFTTLLMSTGLTFGTISSLYGLNAGILDQAQFSVLITVVILSAVVPTVIAQRFFQPAPPLEFGGLSGETSPAE